MGFDRSSWRVVADCEEVLEFAGSFALALTLGRRVDDVGYTLQPIPQITRSVVGICAVLLSLVLPASLIGLAEGSFFLSIPKKSQ